MSKYKININPVAPEKERIESHKDFSKVFRAHKKMRNPWWVMKNIHRKPKVRRVVIAIIIVLLTLYVTSSYFKTEQARVEKERVEEKLKVKPIQP